MFKRLNQDDTIQFTFDGLRIAANQGDTVAAALLNSGTISVRQSQVSLSPRGPFCMMGACYECLVQHEGKTVQACMLSVQAEMVIERATVANTTTAHDHD